MQKTLKNTAKFFAIIFAILFVISFVATLFLYNLEKNAFDPNTYKSALENENIYERLPAVIGDQLVATMGLDLCKENSIACDVENRSAATESCLENALGNEAYIALSNNERPPSDAEKERATSCFEEYGYPTVESNDNKFAPLLKNLTAKDWELFIEALIPPETLKTLGEETINQTFAFFNGNTDFISIPIHYIKTSLLSEKGIDAVFILLEAQPPCSFSDLTTLVSGEIPFCNPPEESQALLKPIIETQIKIALASIPDQKKIVEKSTVNTGFFDIQSLRVLMRLSPLLPILFLLLVTMLMVRSLYTWLRWWGIPLLVAGSISLIMSLLTGPIFRSALNILFLSRTSMQISGSALELIYDLIQTITHGLIENITLYALIITIIGLAMTIGATFSKKTDEEIA
ncbi:MAG: hypothetical protein GY755_00890 [Chloroflexi bacterium]|nr:hypothetical protein [Chloroflexota bacterium]